MTGTHDDFHESSAQAKLKEIIRTFKPLLTPTEVEPELELATKLQAWACLPPLLLEYYADTLMREMKALGTGQFTIAKSSSPEVRDVETGLITERPFILATVYGQDAGFNFQIFSWKIIIWVDTDDGVASDTFLLDPTLPLDVIGW